MGKVKNRDQRRTKAKIFTSGAAGCGNSGPPQPDKRSLEYPCPHCDRVFKQTGRLQEHVTKHHGEAETKEEEAERKVETKVRDVGSSHGHYTHKSPKLLLLEWCQKRQRRKPIYKTFTTYSNQLKHKIVVPDSKDAKKDIVVVLDEEMLQETTEEEAQQYAATAALCLVAGDCPYHRSLPPQYVHVWNHYHEQYLAKKAEEEKEEPKVVPERREREVQSIVMSQENQEVLETTLFSLHPASPATAPGKHSSSSLVRYLVIEGFPRAIVEQAVQEASKKMRGSLMEGVLDWLCFYLPDHEFPAAYSQRSRTQIVSVINTTQEKEIDDEDDNVDNPEIQILMSMGYSLPDAIEALEVANDSPQRALSILYHQLTGLTILEEHDNSTQEQEKFCQEQDNLSEEQELWTEECQVLSAIYDDRLVFLDEASIQVQIQVPSELAQSESSTIWKTGHPKEVDSTDLTLSLWRIGIKYPSSLPLISISCEGMKSKFLQYLTLELSQKSVELLGTSMIHELIETLTNLLSNSSDPEFKLSEDSLPTPEPWTIPEPPSLNSRPVRSLPARQTADTLSQKEAAEENRILLEKQTLLQQNLTKAYKARLSLPAFNQASSITQCIHQYSVVVITGVPGCGKSTQVPQFLLEDFITHELGACCHVVCTQPRRISAMSLASRVAEERNEGVGEVVGFSVRNQHKFSKRTRILYCTTGILLRRLSSDPRLKGISHVVVDEVHERTVEMDLLLLVLKKLLMKARNNCPKVILMSATTAASDFQHYFHPVVGDVPVLNIPGFTFPVREFFLEDVHTALNPKKSYLAHGNGWELSHESDNEDEIPSLPKSKHSSKKKLTIFDHLEDAYELIENLVGYVIQEEQSRGPNFLVRNWNGGGEDCISNPLLEDPGGILIFLPGAMEINKMVQILKKTSKIPKYCKTLVLPLHASLPSNEQKEVFKVLDPQIRKIVVATNIAETSITIPDISIVIDTCLAKEIGFDPQLRISRLDLNWISKASGKQRAGRSGRVKPGACFRLVTKNHWGNLLDQTPPEISRTPLESFCLTVGALLGHGTTVLNERLLSECLTAPEVPHVEAALRTLQEVGAVDEKMHLTFLGQHLVKMPMDVHIGKMLIYGALLRCMDSVLTLASALSYGRPIFLSPKDKKEAADACKREFYAPYQNSKSDHMAIIAAFNLFREVLNNNGLKRAAEFCFVKFLSFDGMQAILQGRQEFGRILCDLGFLPAVYTAQIGHHGTQLDPMYDEFSQNSRFVRAALSAGFYPNLLRIKHPAKKFVATLSGTKQVDGDAKDIRFYDREKGRVFLHPSSVNFKVGSYESEWLVYSDIIETGKIYIRQCSMVPIYAMLAFSGDQIRLKHKEGILLLPGWKAAFQVHPKVGVMIKMLREELENILSMKIAEPSLDLTQNRVILTIMRLLESDGF